MSRPQTGGSRVKIQTQNLRTPPGRCTNHGFTRWEMKSQSFQSQDTDDGSKRIKQKQEIYQDHSKVDMVRVIFWCSAVGHHSTAIKTQINRIHHVKILTVLAQMTWLLSYFTRCPNQSKIMFLWWKKKSHPLVL